MSVIRFSDGVTFDTSGAYRVESRSDGYYVVGRGFLCPVASEQAGQQLIDQLTKPEVERTPPCGD